MPALGSYIFTADDEQARRVADRIEGAWCSSMPLAQKVSSCRSAA